MNTLDFNPTDYGKIFSALIDPNLINDLGTGEMNNSLRNKISSVELEEAFEANQIVDRNYANSCLSCIWLHHDFLDESHSISQNISTTTGSFWHGIMHRREGDYWNSKYWFRQVGNHPVFTFLHSSVVSLLQSSDIRDFKQSFWDPFLFVDMVEKYIGTDSEMEMILRQIQQLEWQLLFNHCYHKAIRPL